MILYYLWLILVAIQGLLSYGTAYRLTKNGGDNGVSLYGWLFVLGLAALVPGLGIYLWRRYRDSDDYFDRQRYQRDHFYTRGNQRTNLDIVEHGRFGDSELQVSANRVIERVVTDANRDCKTRKGCARCHTLYDAMLDSCPDCGAVE
ncbi:MAG: hypothetical protein FWC75_05875 [Oscillospiraceae bacterium]|nr:hypothetical protein [Oscillospiraceae bacterium]